MYGDKQVAYSSGQKLSSWSDSERLEARDRCCNRIQHLEVRTGVVDLLNSWSADCSSKATVKQFGDENTNQLGPTTPVLRSAVKPPRSRRPPVSLVSSKHVTFQTPEAADSQDGSGKLAQRKALQKLGRFRVRDFDVPKTVIISKE